MKSIQSLAAALAAVIAVSGCSPAVQNADETPADEIVLAQINGEQLTKADFEMTQAWLPAFARQLDSNANIEISRFWSLLNIMRIAQDARTKGLLTDAARSLAIKEALAKHNTAAVAAPNAPITDTEIDEYRRTHPDEFLEQMAATVDYALIKNENRIPALALGYHFSKSAQLGYNFIKPKEIKEDHVLGNIKTRNSEGRAIDIQRLPYIYVQNFKENEESAAKIGPFTAADNVLFSCPEAQKAIRETPVGTPIAHNIACSGEWKAFVIPEWRRDAMPMNEEKAVQAATERIRQMRNDACRRDYIAKKIAEMKARKN